MLCIVSFGLDDDDDKPGSNFQKPGQPLTIASPTTAANNAASQNMMMNETSNFGHGSKEASGKRVKEAKKGKRPGLSLQLTDEEDRSKPAGAGGFRGEGLTIAETDDNFNVDPGFEESKILQAVSNSSNRSGQ